MAKRMHITVEFKNKPSIGKISARACLARPVVTSTVLAADMKRGVPAVRTTVRCASGLGFNATQALRDSLSELSHQLSYREARRGYFGS